MNRIKKETGIGGSHNIKRGETKMMWGLMMIVLVSAVLFVGGVMMSFRTIGQTKRRLTFAGMMF